ncbi:MAG: hypothetical protein LBE13_00860 [Bacteroidales bacterium]|nr:hypothetical protein [Bacteroidales bacterium]
MPEAFFDSLSISNKLGDSLGEFKREEIHLFSYFSSILFLYRGNPLADWKYRFIVDQNGYPFSDELNETIARHLLNGMLKDDGNFLAMTDRGSNEYFKFKEMPTLKAREDFIYAACSTNIILPYSKTIRALLNDPEIVKITKIKARQTINNAIVYQQFEELSKAVGVPSNDLVIPAVTWVNYISRDSAED